MTAEDIEDSAGLSVEELVMTSAHALAPKVRHKSMTKSQDAFFF